MALIKCGECGNEVSDKATACPKCGAPVAQTASVAAARPRKKSSPVAGIVSLLVLAGLLSMCFGGNDKSSKTETADKQCAADDLQCKGDKLVVAASVYCKAPVERLAKHSVRWTDGTLELKFSRFRWADKAKGSLTMIGDKAEFQNGFGAYTPVTYECDLADDGKTVLDVRVREGRLPS